MTPNMSIEDQEETTSSTSYPFNSPSISPTLNIDSNWNTHNNSNNERSDLTRANLEVLNNDQQGDGANEEEWKVASRGRTNRKRSNSTQSFVCVVAWLVKPKEDDVRGNALMKHIEQIRRQYDNAHARWEPHVTLIPPFVVPFNIQEEEEEEEGENEQKETFRSIREITDPLKTLTILSKRIKSVCANHSSQMIHFGELSKFNLKRYDTYHLRPNQENKVDGSGTLELITLQNALANVLPEAFEFSRGSISNIKRRKSQQQQKQSSGLPKSHSISSSLNGESTKSVPGAFIPDTGFKPHLTLGQAPGPIKASEINALVEPLLSNSSQSINRIAGKYTGPLSVEMDKIQLFIKPINRSGPYDIYQEFRLG
jgi:2'-5' RNA ligase superfamily